MRNREADFGIGPPPGPGDELTFEPLLRDRFVVVCKKSHPLADKEVVTLRETLAYPLLSLASGTNIRTAVLFSAFASQGLTLKPAFEAFHRYTLLGMVDAALGVALLPAMVISNTNRKLQARRLVDPEIYCEFGIIEHRDHAMSPAGAAFLSTLKKTASSRIED